MKARILVQSLYTGFKKNNNLYSQVKEKSPTDVNMNQAWTYIASIAYVSNFY